MSTVEEVKEFMKLHNMKQSYLANSLMISGAQLSQFLNGKYHGDVETLTQNLKKFIQNFSKNLELKQDDTKKFLELSYTDEALYNLNEAVSEHEMLVLTGQPGTGKTTLVKHFVENNPNAIYVTARESTTTKILFKKICNELSISYSNSTDEMISDIIIELNNGSFILVIDESEHLKYTGLEGLRSVWDDTQTPIILVGTDILVDNLLGKDNKYGQLSSRIGSYSKLRGITKADTIKVFAHAGIELDSIILDFIYKATKGNFRTSVKILKRVRRTMKSFKVDVVNMEVAKDAIGMIILGRGR